jgi:hypothetical protein
MPQYHTLFAFCLPACFPNLEVLRSLNTFAADYQEEEYRLIGLAIKFAGICGKEVRIIGTNRPTLDQSTVTH